MANEKQKFSQEGLNQLKQELEDLINVQRPNVVKEIAAAREMGDLSENSEYDMAKTHQANIESRIAQLENIIHNAEVVSDAKASKNQGVGFGNTVTITDLRNNKVLKFQIVSEIEADPIQNKVSFDSPIAQAILGKNVGSEVVVSNVEKPYSIKITAIN